MVMFLSFLSSTEQQQNNVMIGEVLAEVLDILSIIKAVSQGRVLQTHTEEGMFARVRTTRL